MTDDTHQRHPARKSRIAAMGIGVAAMAGLVGNMELAGRSQAAATASATTASHTPELAAARRHAETLAGARAAALSRPIVLTPHVVVHSVAAPAAPSSGGYVYAAAPAAASAPVASAPVASTGGSHP
jgi:hypothetical protein